MRNTILKICALLTLIFYMGFFSANAQNVTDIHQEMGLNVQWSSGNKNADQLALALEQLYVTLYNTGNLPTKKFVDSKQTGSTIESILRTKRLFFGGFFPQGVDSVMCDINPTICTRLQRQISTKKLTAVTEHVGGYKKSNGLWKNSPGSTITIPNIKFTSNITLEEIPYPREYDLKQLEEMMKKQNAHCSEWKISCWAVVKKLNLALFDPRRSQNQPPNTIIIPVPGVKAEILISGTESSVTRSLVEQIENISEVTTRIPRNDSLRFSNRWKKQIQSKAPADVGIEALSRNIESFGKAMPHSFSDNNFVEQTDLLTLIHHPFKTSKQVDESLKKPIPVLVVDTLLDKEHCEFGDNVEILTEDLVINHATLASRRPPANECGKRMAVSPNLVDDHGTHVVGLIASAANGEGIIGLNPYANLKFLPIDIVQLQGPSYRQSLATQLLMQAFRVSPKVANLSWQYTNQLGKSDSIHHSINALKQNVLFVVAAGNSMGNLDDACDALPACFSKMDNVITVVGLDREQNPPGLWAQNGRGSNRSNQFNIGAIAENVLSTTHNDYTGRLSGTSQAAPQVTAAASLLYSLHESHYQLDRPELLPIQVKNRLIYSADLFNELLHKFQGGRLNIERLLDVSNDYLQVKTTNGVRNFKGSIVKFGKGLIKCKGGNDIAFKDIRRMFYDERRRRYVIFTNTISGNRESSLKRIDGCRLTTRSNLLIIETDKNEELTFKFRDIRDFISAMF